MSHRREICQGRELQGYIEVVQQLVREAILDLDLGEYKFAARACLDAEEIIQRSCKGGNPEIKTLLAEVLGIKGMAFEASGDLDSAVKAYKKTLRIQYSLVRSKVDKETKISLGISLFRLSRTHRVLADYSKAIDFGEKAFLAFRKERNKRGQANALTEIGISLGLSGKHKNALAHFERAFRLLHSEEDQQAQISVLVNMSQSHSALGSHHKATRSLKKALTIAKALGDDREQASILVELGNTCLLRTDYKLAVVHFSEALTISENIKDEERISSICIGLSHAYNFLSNYHKAIDFCEKGLRISGKTGDLERQGGLFTNLCVAYGGLGDFQKEIHYGERALKIFEQIENPYGQAIVSGNLGTAHSSLGDYEKGMKYLRDSLRIFEKFKDSQSRAKTLCNISEVYIHLGDYAKAIECADKAREIFTQIQDRYNLTTALGALAEAYRLSGKISRALEYSEKALAVAKQNEDKGGLAKELNSIALVYGILGNYRKAIRLAEEAVSIFQKIGMRQDEARVLSNLGGISLSLGDFDKGIEYTEKARRIYDEIGDLSGQAESLVNLSLMLFTKSPENRNKALNYAQKSLELSEKIGEPWGQAKAIRNLSLMNNWLGKHSKALECGRKALEILERIGDEHGQAIVLDTIGHVFASLSEQEKDPEQKLKAYSSARDSLLKSIEICRLAAYKYGEYLSQARLGRLEISRSNCTEAYKWLKQSIEIIERIRGTLIQEAHKISFQRRYPHVYEDMVSVCFRLDKKNEAFSYTEAGKCRSLLEQMATIKLKPFAELTPPLIQLLKKEEECLSFLRSFRTPSKMHTLTYQRPSADKIESMFAELEVVYNEIERLDPEYVSLRRGTPLSSGEVQDLLDSQQRSVVIIEYLHDKEELFIFLFRSQGKDFVTKLIPISSDELYEYIGVYFDQVVNYPLSLGNQTWIEVSKYLIAPIAEYVHRGDILYFVPHGVLHYLPMHCLLNRVEPIIHRHPVAYCPSASVLKLCQKRKPGNMKTGLVVGVSPFKDESNIISEIFESKLGSQNVTRLVGQRISKSQLMRVCRKKDIIHFSCHGYFNNTRPLESGIWLAPEIHRGHVTSEEILTVSDIFDLRLQANLVTISACETAISQHNPGDELIGLIRACFYAGCPSLVASLWRVDAQSTKNLMVEFYRNVFKPMNKVDALQKAQIKIMETQGFQHPYYWAPFILLGDWR